MNDYFDFEEFDEKCAEIRDANDELLSLFDNELTDAGLSPKTIVRHLRNVDFYINTFLLREEPLTMDHGTYMLNEFLGYYFIRKCMWSTPETIKTTAASIKKFYKCMLNHDKIRKEQYDSLCADIKDNMLQWQLDCAMYNDPAGENPFKWL